MKRIVFLSLVFLGLAVFFNAIQPAFAQDEAEDKNRVKISALLDRQDVVGGDTVFVALIQEIEDGGHSANYKLDIATRRIRRSSFVADTASH